MKKKFFNLAVILATLMSSTVFYSCDKDDDKDGEDQEDLIDDEKDEENIEENIKDQDSDVILKSEELSVVMGQKYAAYNESIAGGALNFTVTNTTINGEDKTVTFTVELKGDDADGKSFTIGDADDMPSYFGRVDGELKACKQTEAVKNARNMIFALSNDAQACLITSATVNAQVRAAGATMTVFGTYLK